MEQLTVWLISFLKKYSHFLTIVFVAVISSFGTYFAARGDLAVGANLAVLEYQKNFEISVCDSYEPSLVEFYQGQVDEYRKALIVIDSVLSEKQKQILKNKLVKTN